MRNIDFTKYAGEIDLLIGGSPCQGFSFAGKQLNFNDPRSKLFFEFVRALKELKPKYFLLENVKMKKEFEDIISEFLGVKPIEINSALVSAQNRKRLYWTNIPVNGLPEDKGILLKDIVHEYSKVDRDKSLCLLAGYDSKFQPKRYFEKHIHQAIFEEIKEYIVPFDKTLQILDKEVQRGKISYFCKGSQRVYYIHNKEVTPCGVLNSARGNNQGGLRYNGEKSPAITTSKWEHNNYLLFGCLTPDRVVQRQNGQRFNDGTKFYTLTAQDRHGVLIEGYIRKLTPIECERLQTLPDNYTAGISNPQRYKTLGNGWTVDVIAHILKGIFESEV